MPSVENSPNSDTRANEALLRACAEAVEELRAARKLIDARGVEIRRYDELLRLEREISAKAKAINELSEMERAELRKALMAKDAQIAALEAAIVVLKKERSTVWKTVKNIGLGVAAGIILGSVLR